MRRMIPQYVLKCLAFELIVLSHFPLCSSCYCSLFWSNEVYSKQWSRTKLESSAKCHKPLQIQNMNNSQKYKIPIQVILAVIISSSFFAT